MNDRLVSRSIATLTTWNLDNMKPWNLDTMTPWKLVFKLTVQQAILSTSQVNIKYNQKKCKHIIFSNTKCKHVLFCTKCFKPELLLADELFLFERKQNNSSAECSLSTVPIQNSLPVFFASKDLVSKKQAYYFGAFLSSWNIKLESWISLNVGK